MTPQLGAASPRPPNYHKKGAAMPRLAMAKNTKESDMSIQSAGFVVIGETLWGFGATESDAWDNFLTKMAAANINVVDHRSIDTDGVFLPEEALASDFRLVAATASLLRTVENDGSPRSWSQIGVVCCTDAEAQDHESAPIAP